MDTTDFDAREAAELAEDAAQQDFQRLEQRIRSLEYGIDAALDAMSDLDDGTDPEQVIASVRSLLTTYRTP
ncbi:hypothetical protein ACWDE0_22060 [Streptomyces sp. 900105755]